MGGGSLFVDGDYVLKQKWPFRAKGGYYLPYKRFPLLDPSDHKIKLQETLLPNIIFGYRNRNNTLDYQQTYKVWTPSPASRTTTGRTHIQLDDGPARPQQGTAPLPRPKSRCRLKYYACSSSSVPPLPRLRGYNQLVDTTMRVETPHEREGVKATSL